MQIESCNAFELHRALAQFCQTIWIVDAHRDNRKRFIVRADEKLSAFVELERQVQTGELLPLFRIFLSIIWRPELDSPQSAVKWQSLVKQDRSPNKTMNHEPFHIYTAKIAIPKSDIGKNSRYETEIQKKYPGMKLEFVEDDSANVKELSVNADGPSQGFSSVRALTGQLYDLVIKISRSN
jgi:hypothetical protein